MDSTTSVAATMLTHGKRSTQFEHNSSDILAVNADGSDAHIDPKHLRLDINGQPDFSYGSNAGPYSPMNWGHISEKYETCAHGREQSPINIRKPTQLTKKAAPTSTLDRSCLTCR